MRIKSNPAAIFQNISLADFLSTSELNKDDDHEIVKIKASFKIII